MNRVQGLPQRPRDLNELPGTEWNLLVSTSKTLPPGLSILGLDSHSGLSLAVEIGQGQQAALTARLSSFLAHSGIVRAV